MGRIKILYGGQFQTMLVDGILQIPQFFVGPKLPPIVADAPIRPSICSGKSDSPSKVIDPVSDYVRCPSLPGKTKVLGSEHMPIKRSEEHTSESSHGYISYAVFCLKKKKKIQNNSVIHISSIS